MVAGMEEKIDNETNHLYNAQSTQSIAKISSNNLFQFCGQPLKYPDSFDNFGNHECNKHNKNISNYVKFREFLIIYAHTMVLLS
jgi:hypothetical protein